MGKVLGEPNVAHEEEKMSRRTPARFIARTSEIVDAVNFASGQDTRRGGFSAYQRLLGRPLRLPGHILEEEGHSDLVQSRVCSGDTQLTRDILFRQEAMKAYIEADSSERWRRAPRRKNRLGFRDNFNVGDLTCPWRELEKGGAPDARWRGPARVLRVEAPGAVWRPSRMVS